MTSCLLLRRVFSSGLFSSFSLSLQHPSQRSKQSHLTVPPPTTLAPPSEVCVLCAAHFTHILLPCLYSGCLVISLLSSHRQIQDLIKSLWCRLSPSFPPIFPRSISHYVFQQKTAQQLHHLPTQNCHRSSPHSPNPSPRYAIQPPPTRSISHTRKPVRSRGL